MTILNPDETVKIVQLPYGITEPDIWVHLTCTLAATLHQIAVDHGFYPDGTRNDAECIALMHSELSEALEAMRHGNPVRARESRAKVLGSRAVGLPTSGSTHLGS